MYSLGNIVFDIAMTIAAVWIVKRFWGSFFTEKKPDVWSNGTLIAYAALQMCFQVQRGSGNPVLLIANIVLIFLVAITGYECRGKSKFFLLAVFCTVWLLMEFLAFFMIGNLPMRQESIAIFGEVISKLLMMIVVYVLSIFWGRKQEGKIPNKFFLWLFFIPLGSGYIAFSEFYLKIDHIFAMIVISILLVFNVIIYELYIKMNDFYIRERENAMYAQQMDMIAANTAEQKRMMEEFHEEKHNLVNELIVLKELIGTKRSKEAIENIDEIIKGRYYSERISDTGNSTVDAIINFKYALASESGITFSLKAFIPQELPIAQKDIGVVLGNALDNAIEATKACTQSDKKIEISMGVKKEAWVIVIRNPYENEIKQDRAGEIITSKKDKTRHGYGLKSIRKISEKYQGDAIVDTENNVFTLTVVLNFGEFRQQIA